MSRNRSEEQTDVLTYEADPDERATEAVTVAVAEAADRHRDEMPDVYELPPLYEVVDPDALDDLFRSEWSDSPTEGRVSFSYYGFLVTLDAEGRVSVEPRERD